MSNLYEILCVEPTSTIDEINEAYLELLAIYRHIGRPKNFVPKSKYVSGRHSNTYDAYKEIDYAYSILADPEKRNEYNKEFFRDVYDYEMLLAETNRDYECCIQIKNPFGEYYTPDDENVESDREIPYTIEEEDNRTSTCPTVYQVVEIPLEKAYDNEWIETEMSFTQRCTRCRGSGYEKNVKSIICPECLGLSPKMNPPMCPKCNGKGTIIPIGFICSHCGGKRTVKVNRTFEFRFEKGFNDDIEVVFENKGNETDVSKPGDVCFKLVVVPGNDWDVNGHDLIYKCPISGVDIPEDDEDYEYQFYLPNGIAEYIFINEGMSPETVIEYKNRGLTLDPRTIPSGSTETRGSLFITFENLRFDF